MTEHKTKWWDRMIALHGSEDAVRAFMKSNQEKSMQNPKRQAGRHKGGFNYLDKATHSKLSREAAKKRWQS